MSENETIKITQKHVVANYEDNYVWCMLEVSKMLEAIVMQQYFKRTKNTHLSIKHLTVHCLYGEYLKTQWHKWSSPSDLLLDIVDNSYFFLSPKKYRYRLYNMAQQFIIWCGKCQVLQNSRHFCPITYNPEASWFKFSSKCEVNKSSDDACSTLLL